jgi:hypothetical protein
MEALGLVVVFLVVGLAAVITTVAAALLVTFESEPPPTSLRTPRATPGTLVRLASVPAVEPQSDATLADDPPAAA